MTPKEKALELGNKFYQGNPLVYSKEEHLQELENAKARALILVDEILNLKNNEITKGTDVFVTDTDEIYWNEVKTEIEKL